MKSFFQRNLAKLSEVKIKAHLERTKKGSRKIYTHVQKFF